MAFNLNDYEIKVKKPNMTELLQKIEAQEKYGLSEKDINKKMSSSSVSIADKVMTVHNRILTVLGKQRVNILVIKTKAEFDEYVRLAIASGFIAIDTETNNSLDPVTCKLMGLCLYYPGGKQAYIPVNHVNLSTRERLSWQLTEEDCRKELQKFIDNNTYKIMHNGKFDYEVIKCTCNIEVAPDWDTMVAARLIDENDLAGLKYLYTKFIDPGQSKYSLEKLVDGMLYELLDPEVFALYAATDSMMTYKLYAYQKRIMDAEENKKLYALFTDVEMPIVTITGDMELKGVTVDQNLAARLKDVYDKKLQAIDNNINEILAGLSSMIVEWRKLPSSNAITRQYQPVNSKKSLAEIEAAFPEIAEDGRRYKPGKSKTSQLGDPINLASPVQLGILFYDILEVPVVSKKSPSGTGVDNLKGIIDALALKIADYNKAMGRVAIALENNSENDIGDELEAELSEVTDREESETQEGKEDTLTVDEIEVPYDFNMQKAQAAIDLAKLILKRRAAAKLITTYIDVIPKLALHWPDGRIRFHMKALGTDTGRYSSGGKIKYTTEKGEQVTVSGINIQNIPSRGDGKILRMLFKAAEEYSVVDAKDNIYTIPEYSEVETSAGWKYPKDLAVGDIVVGDNTNDIIKTIIKQDKNYLLYV